MTFPKIVKPCGPRFAVLDTAATNIWFDSVVFAKSGGYCFEKSCIRAGAADGNPLDVLGRGRRDFSLWGPCRKGCGFES
jgi:hypothetical protein